MIKIQRKLGLLGQKLWDYFRQISGEDAYERYLAHWHAHHAGNGKPPMDRKTFYNRRQDESWNGVRRCC